VITFARLKYLSFAHSAIYFTLLVLWLTDGPDGLRQLFGWAHGIGWIVMSLLCIAAVRLLVIPLWLAVMVAVVGGVGPEASRSWCMRDALHRQNALWNAVWSKASNGGQHHGGSDHASDG
jgi:hypothetical protein